MLAGTLKSIRHKSIGEANNGRIVGPKGNL